MIKIDSELKSLIPALSKEEFEQLEKNILEEGIREPIVVWLEPKEKEYCEDCHDNVEVGERDGDHYECLDCGYGFVGEFIIIDGHNRYEIACKHDIDFERQIKYFENKEEAIDWMINNQLGRRNLTKETQSYLRGLQYKREKKKNNGFEDRDLSGAQNEQRKTTAEKLAEQHKVSRETIKRDELFTDAVDTIVKNTSPEVKQKLLNKEINITKNDIEKVSKHEPEKQKAIIDKMVNKEAKSYIDAKRLIKKDEVHEVPETKGKYKIIYADPPWCYGNKLVEGYGTAENHYPTMTIQELCELPIKELAEDNAVLFLWVTSPLLEECFQVIKAWGFKYKTSFVWDKVKHNMGHYNSVRHELLLICTKGSCLPDNKKLFDSVVEVERTNKHSEKPEQFREIIDTIYSCGKRIELFARKKTDKWDVWGNQT
jgi:N6-adenosine-specific RNA methylase IME4